MTTPATTTQGRRPWRAMLRTGVQTALAVVPILGYVVPEVVQIILEETGEAMPAGIRTALLVCAAVVVALASIVARVMAIPAVEAFLRRHALVRGLAADPPPRVRLRDRDVTADPVDLED